MATFLAIFKQNIELRETDPTRMVQRSALYRSRRELPNAYLLAKFGFDTAENAPSKVWPMRPDIRSKASVVLMSANF